MRKIVESFRISVFNIVINQQQSFSIFLLQIVTPFPVSVYLFDLKSPWYTNIGTVLHFIHVHERRRVSGESVDSLVQVYFQSLKFVWSAQEAAHDASMKLAPHWEQQMSLLIVLAWVLHASVWSAQEAAHDASMKLAPHWEELMSLLIVLAWVLHASVHTHNSEGKLSPAHTLSRTMLRKYLLTGIFLHEA